MRRIGFSTGAIALGDFRSALSVLKETDTQAVELSALRDHEVEALMSALPSLDLRRYSYVSVHLPSAFKSLSESAVVARLQPCIDLKIPVVIHPDAIQDATIWSAFGSLLCIENMDKRKRTGRTMRELEGFFSTFANASFCLDIGHARQIDSTMGETSLMLKRFGSRLREVHISEIDAHGHHHGLSLATILASQRIARMIGNDVPIIIESQIPTTEISREIDAVKRALTPSSQNDWKNDWGALA